MTAAQNRVSLLLRKGAKGKRQGYSPPEDGETAPKPHRAIWAGEPGLWSLAACVGAQADPFPALRAGAGVLLG